MLQENAHHYLVIEKAIAYLHAHYRQQPSLEDIAAHVHLSPMHLQKVFTAWAGVSPKKLLQYLSLEHAKTLLHQQASVFEAAIDTGLSGAGRLHDLFVSIEAMTPGEYKDGGAGLRIQYSFADSVFGTLLVAGTAKGICAMAFADDTEQAVHELRLQYPRAQVVAESTEVHALSLTHVNGIQEATPLRLHISGTPFQLKVWEALLRIPEGRACTYGQIATHLGQPTAARAVGSAVGENPIACIIPCHRVIRAEGLIGQYHWGSTRKAAMLARETALQDLER